MSGPTILGLDIASTAIDGCLLIPGHAPILRRQQLGQPKWGLLQRMSHLKGAVDAITRIDGVIEPLSRPDWLVIEDAFGRFRKADRALHMVIGGIVACAPPETRVALISCGDWRTAIGATTNTKAAGHATVIAHYNGFPQWIHDPTEHALDAIGIALGWATILEGGAER